jgi:hypothetical protein
MGTIIIIIVVVVVGSIALSGPWTPQENGASDLYPGHAPANFYNPVSLRFPLVRPSILISVGHVLDLQRVHNIFLGKWGPVSVLINGYRTPFPQEHPAGA